MTTAPSLIYSLVKSYEITPTEKCDKNIPDFLILGEYRKYIQEKYNVKDGEKVDKIGKMIVFYSVIVGNY